MGGRPKTERPPLPLPAPDMADRAVRDASTAARNAQLASSGRRSTFLTAGGSAASAPTPDNVARASSAGVLPWDYGLEQIGQGNAPSGQPQIVRNVFAQRWAAGQRGRGTY